jgi:glycosyltransferase involved in cell wall biosynthesis
VRVALVHYWLVGMRGGEKVLDALCEMYPTADVFTHVVVPEKVSGELRQHKIHTSFIARLPRATTWYKKYLPLMPLALEQFDLSGYDLVISSESGPAKGIVPAPGAVHVCYCHSPMRYIWNMYHDYRSSAGWLARLAMPCVGHYLRSWDQLVATRVDSFVANSWNVAARIRRYYGRDSTVIYPPVDVDSFAPVPRSDVEDYFLMVGELVPYKRPDLAVEAFNRLGKRLVVIGGGEMLSTLRRRARSNITFLGSQPFDVLRHHYARCRALIFPGEEDFGIVPVEAMASGRPVIAFGRGGATETVVDGRTGYMFEHQSLDALIAAIERSEKYELKPDEIIRHARRFGPERFKREMSGAVTAAIEENARTAMPKPFEGLQAGEPVAHRIVDLKVPLARSS